MADGFFIILNNYATLGIIYKYTKERILKRIYKDRVDIIDITNQKFGDLTAIKINGRGKYRGAIWLCKCDCGNECNAYGGQLRSGKRKSCGCRSESRVEETGVNNLFSMYKRKSRLRNINFALSRDEFHKLIKGNCAYCGIEPSQLLKRPKSKKPQILYNGIDRIDSSKSYIIDNCVSACRYCNQSKSDLDLEEWKSHLKRMCKWLQISSS